MACAQCVECSCTRIVVNKKGEQYCQKCGNKGIEYDEVFEGSDERTPGEKTEDIRLCLRRLKLSGFPGVYWSDGENTWTIDENDNLVSQECSSVLGGPHFGQQL